MKDRRRTRATKKPEVIKANDTRNHNIVEEKTIKTTTKTDRKGGDVNITIKNEIYTHPQAGNSQGLTPPQYEPVYMSEIRQSMTGRNIHGGRSNANPFAYSPSSQVFTGPAGHPVIHNHYNYANPPPAFGAPPPVATPPATPAVGTPPPAVAPATPVPAPFHAGNLVIPQPQFLNPPLTPQQWQNVLDEDDQIDIASTPVPLTPQQQNEAVWHADDEHEEDDDLEDDDIDDEVIDIDYESDDDDEDEIDTSMDPVLRDRLGPWFSKKGKYLITPISHQQWNKKERREIERDHYLKGIIGRRPNKNTQRRLGFGPNSVLRIERALKKIKQAKQAQSPIGANAGSV